MLTVSLDIANAFNSFSWDVVCCALGRRRFPLYISAVSRNYLRTRKLRYRIRGADEVEREASCRVPQGSVLRPLLWNLAFDATF